MSTWDLDPAHSQIEFAVRHMMVATVRGQFRKFTAAVDFDEANPERSAVEAHIDASSIETGMEARDAHLRSAGFSASTKISRKAWGLTWNGALESGGVLVGEDIRITMDVAVVQAEATATKVAVARAA